jgi:hypothetical protein
MKMKVLTIANIKKVSEKAKAQAPALVKKVEAEYIAKVEQETANSESEYLTEFEKSKIKAGRFPVEHYAENITKRINKTHKAQEVDRLNAILESNKEIKRIVVATDWRRGSMQSNQCKAEIKVTYADYSRETFESDRTGGCGYDKESTAIADAFNRINALLKELALKASEAIEQGEGYREFIGYGCGGYNTLPYFEGGVGFNSQVKILSSLGYKMNHLHWTKKTDIYEFVKE